MSATRRSERLASLFLLVAVAAAPVAEAAWPQKADDEPVWKLPAFLTAKPFRAGAGDDESRKLLTAKYDAAAGAAKDSYESFVHGRGSADEMHGSFQRLVQSGLELCDAPAQRVALLTQYVEATAEAEKVVRSWHGLGRCRIGDVHRARYERLDAEVQLLRAKREAERAPGK